MKKLLVSLALALGFTSLVTAQSTAPTWPSPQPLNQYQLSNTTMAVDGFKDLGAEQPPFDGIIPLGSSLTASTALNDVYYYFPLEDGAPSFTATKSAEENGTAMEALSLASMGFEFKFMEKPITGLIISALGGIFFTDATHSEEQSASITAKKAGTALADLAASYAFLAYPYKGTDLVTATVQENVMPAQMAFGADENGQKFILVQYNYVVDGTNTWKFQLKATEDGTVSCLVDALNRSESAYNFALGVKRGDETLLLGGNSESSISVITDQTKGWAIPTPPSYFPQMTPALTNHTLSVSPKMAEVFNIAPEYATLTAEVSIAPDAVEKINQAASVVAFVTTNANPTIRHDETTKYKVGDKVAMQFPVVYEGKPTLSTENNTFTINATGLKPGTDYYLFHLFGNGKKDGEYTYSTTPFAISEQFSMKEIENPVSVSAGTPNSNKIPLTIDAPAAFSLLVVKSTSADIIIAPVGKLSVGDTYQYEDAWTGEITSENKVIAILTPGTQTYDLEMTPGEGTYVQIFTAVNPETDGAAYSEGMAMTPAYLRGSLPLAYTFGPKDVPPMAYGEIAMPILPPGMSTSTVLPDKNDENYETEGQKIVSSAFVASAPDFFNRENVFLTSNYPYDMDYETGDITMDTRWCDVIAPAFSDVAKVQATFRVKMLVPVGQSLSNHKPTTGDSIRIEYSLNGNEWQTAKLFIAGTFPDAEAGIYPLTVDFACAKTDEVRIRYSYRTGTAGVMHAIVSYEFLEGRDCETPTDIQMVVDGTTDKALALKWTDRNVPAAGNYTVYYQKFVEPAGDDEEGGIMPWAELGDETTGEETEEDVWETLEVKTTEALLRNLDANSTYSVKIQAVCKTEESYASNPVRLSTFASMPYIEPLTGTFDDYSNAFKAFNGVQALSGAIGGNLETYDYTAEEQMPESWNLFISSQAQQWDYMNPLENAAMAVATWADQAWLTLPTVYVRKIDAFFPKTLRFKANTFTYQATEHNIDLKDTDLRLYVLASTNGKFTWDDTVKGFNHADFIVETAGTETADAAAVSGKELTVDLSQFEGAVSIAFYFHNPNKLEMPDYGIGGYAAKGANAKAGEEDEEPAEPMFLEIFDLAFTYDDEPIWPVFNLKAEADVYDATLTWEGEGLVYGIVYGPTDAEAASYTTVYQNAQEQDVQSIKLENLTADTKYKAIVTSYTDEAHTQASPAMTVEFTTLKEMFTVTVTVTPENAGTIKGNGSYFVGDKVTLTAEAAKGYTFTAWKNGDTELSTEATFTFDMPAENLSYTAVFTGKPEYEVTLTASPAEAGTVTGADKYAEGDTVTVTAAANKGFVFVAWTNGTDTLSRTATYKFEMPGEDVAYTAVFKEEVSNEELLKAGFNVSTKDGQLIVRNLNAVTVKDVDVYGLTGNRINRFVLNSREDLMLPVDAQRAILFVRLNTEQGVAIYKVYLQ